MTDALDRLKTALASRYTIEREQSNALSRRSWVETRARPRYARHVLKDVGSASFKTCPAGAEPALQRRNKRNGTQ